MSNLGTAIAIAAEAFQHKTDKGGQAYILHCLHVMQHVQHYNDEALMIIAVLHDLVEDTDYTFEQLETIGFSARVITALRLLTHQKDVPYMDYIKQLAGNKDAVRVKMQDLKHNSDLMRIKHVTQKDLQRVEKYHWAWGYLNSGNYHKCI